MSFNLTQVNTAALIVGTIVWVASLGAVWLLHRNDSASRREQDFMLWKNLYKNSNASFSEFLASEQAPRIYMSRVELSAAVTVIALLALALASCQWGVWQ